GGNPDLDRRFTKRDRRKRCPEPYDRRLDKERRHFTCKIAGSVSEDGERRFVSREKDMASLADHARRERLRITLIAEREEAHRPLEIVLWRATFAARAPK